MAYPSVYDGYYFTRRPRMLSPWKPGIALNDNILSAILGFLGDYRLAYPCEIAKDDA